MAKLALLSAFVGAAFGMVAAPAHACRGKDHCPTHREEADDDDDNDADDDDGGNSSTYHIRITGRVFHGIAADEAPEPPEPPPPPPPPPRPVRIRAPAYIPPPRVEVEAPTVVHTYSAPSEERIGVGARASEIHVGRGGPDAAGAGVLLRFRTRPVELELDVGRDEYLGGAARSDTRLGAGLYVPLVAARVAPFLLAGAGVNFSYFNATNEELHQGYLAGGGGVAFAASSRFTLDLDARYMLRQFFEGTAERDQAVEMRLSGIVYF
jgi:hypothetical protein